MQDRNTSLTPVIVLSGVSLLVAVATFGLLRSYAAIRGTAWEAGGAIAGFLITFLILFRSALVLRRNRLTNGQAMALIQLYEGTIAHRMLRETFRLLHMLERGLDRPSRERIKQAAEAIRNEARELTSCFETKLGSFPDLLRNTYEPYFEEDLDSALDVIFSEMRPEDKRESLIRLYDELGANMIPRYRERLEGEARWSW